MVADRKLSLERKFKNNFSNQQNINPSPNILQPDKTLVKLPASSSD